MSTINVTNQSSVRDAFRAIRNIVIAVGVVILLAILFSASTFTVGEAEQATVLRFGKIHTVILDPNSKFAKDNPDLMNADGSTLNDVAVIQRKGLFFRIPLVDQVKKYQSKLLTYVSQEETVNTKDKKQYMIQMFAQWRVANPALFYQVYQSESSALKALDNTIYPILIQSINQMQAEDFLSNKDQLNTSLANSLKSMNNTLRDGGIEVADVEVNRTLLPQANLQSTYDRMIANRQKVAQQLRSEGQEAYQKAVSEADLEASKLIADATRQSKEVKGQADATALEIYAKSYSKDSEFYGYWRSLQAMVNSLTHDATIVLDKNHPLWKDLLDMISAGQVTAK